MVRFGAGAFTCALFLVAVPALAQVPSTAEPGRIEQRFKPAPTPQSAPEILIPGPEALIPDAEVAKIHFQLSEVVIEGATVFKTSDFAPLYQRLLDNDVSLAQIFALRDAITAKYREAGYVLSQAIVPPQTISRGVIRIRIVEGYVDHIEYQGDAHDNRGLVKDIAEKITEERPLNVSVLERYVLLANDIPGLTVKTVIKPSANTPGAATLVFVIDHTSVSGQAQIDNRGSRAIGPGEAQFGVNFNSLLGLDEQTSVLLATTQQPKQLQYGQLTSLWILSAEGLRLTASGSYSNSKPSGAIAVLDSTGRSLTTHATLDYPLIRSRSENLHLSAEFTYLNSTTDLLDTRFSDDRLRYLTAGATYDVSDTLLGDEWPGSNIVEAELNQGLDVLDASKTRSPLLSRANGHSNFTMLYAEGSRTQSLSHGLSLAIAFSGQWSSTPLLSPVQFGLGGSRFGRGYEPSELTGDEGLAGSLEGRYDLPFDIPLITGPQLYAFYDVGQIWNIDPLPGTPANASLASAGLGLRFTFLQRFSSGFELAKPLTRPIASRGNKDVRPLFNIAATF